MKRCLKCRSVFQNPDWSCPAYGHAPMRENGFLFFAPEHSQTSDGFETRFFEQLTRLEPENFWFRARNRLVLWALERYFPRARNFLEIGCGTGFVLSGIEQRFPQWDVFGSDIHSAALRFAARRAPKAQLFQMDARNIPFTKEFDVIGAFDMLEHIQDDESVLREAGQALKPGGGLLLTVPQHAFLWSGLDDYGHHYRRYNARELKAKITAAGLDVVTSTSFVSLLLPLVVMSRWRLRASTLEQDILSEFRIGPLANRILEKVLDLERIMIAGRVRFPWGSSLLVVARKPTTP